MLICLTGCWNSRELNTIGIVAGIGIDKGAKPDYLDMTVQLVKTSELKAQSGKGGGSGGRSDAYVNIYSTGRDPIDILRQFTHQTNRKIYLPHNEVIILGKDMAEAGVKNVLDVFMRDHEARMTVEIIVSREKAASVLEVQPQLGKITALEISQLLDVQTATSESAKISLFEFATCLASKTCCPVAPLIETKKIKDKDVIYLTDFAVFKGDKLAGELDKKESRGFLWAMNKVKSGIVEVNLENRYNGEKELADIEIIKAKGKIKPVVKENGEIYVNVMINEVGSIASKKGNDNFATRETKRIIEKAQEEVIKQEVLSAFKKSQELNCDIFGIGEKIKGKHPSLWRKVEKTWDKKYPKIKIKAQVKCKLAGSGRIINTIGAKE